MLLPNDYWLDKILTKSFLLSPRALRHMAIDDEFPLTPTVMALYDLRTRAQCEWSTVIVDAKFGCLLTHRTTRQLINHFLHHNLVDLHLSRILLLYHQRRRFLPLILGNAVYLPLHGAQQTTSDWIGLHWQRYFFQNRAAQWVQFQTLNHYHLQFAYSSRRNLLRAIHDACYLAHYCYWLTVQLVQNLGYQLQASTVRNLLWLFEQCSCTLHKNLPPTAAESKRFLQTFQIWTLQQVVALPEFSWSAQMQQQVVHEWFALLMGHRYLW